MSDLKAVSYATDYTLDHFISQDLSKLTACNAPELVSRFPQSTYWIVNFTLNSRYGRPVDMDARKFCLGFLRRAEAAFFTYEFARQALLDFEASVNHGPRKTSVYFRALHFFEVCIAMHWQAIDLFRKLSKEDAYDKGDGSSIEKLHKIYNASRHYDPTSLPSHLLHKVWITNKGINIEGVCLTFEQLEDLMIDLGKTADYASSVSFHGKSNKGAV